MKFPYRGAKSQLLVHEFQLHFFLILVKLLCTSVYWLHVSCTMYLLTISQWSKIWKKPHWEKFPKNWHWPPVQTHHLMHNFSIFRLLCYNSLLFIRLLVDRFDMLFCIVFICYYALFTIPNVNKKTNSLLVY